MKLDLFGKKAAAAKELERIAALKLFANENKWVSIDKTHIKRLVQGTRIGAVNGKILGGFVKQSEENYFYLFDYIYHISSGNSYQKFHQTIFIYHPKNRMMEFRIYPKNIFHKFWDFITFANSKKAKGKNLKSKYRIKSKIDPKILKLKFTNKFKFFLIEDPTIYLESKSNHLIFFRNGKVIEKQNLANQFSFFQSLIQNIK